MWLELFTIMIETSIANQNPKTIIFTSEKIPPFCMGYESISLIYSTREMFMFIQGVWQEKVIQLWHVFLRYNYWVYERNFCMVITSKVLAIE